MSQKADRIDDSTAESARESGIPPKPSSTASTTVGGPASKAPSRPPSRSTRAPGSIPPGEARRRVFPDLLRRGLEKGIEAGLNTWENSLEPALEKTAEMPGAVRDALSDGKLPKELASAMFHQIEDTRNGVLRAVASEFRDFLEATDLAGEIKAALTSISFEIKTEVRFIPNEAGTGVKPQVKAKSKVKTTSGSKAKTKAKPRAGSRSKTAAKSKPAPRPRQRRTQSSRGKPSNDV